MRFPKASRVIRLPKNKLRKSARNAPSTRPSPRRSDRKLATKGCGVGKFSVGFSQELAGIGRRFAGIFVFAVSVDVHALAKPRVEAFFPGAQLHRRVVFQAQAGVGETSGYANRGGVLLR